MPKRGNPYTKTFHADGRLYGKYKEKPNEQISLEDLQRALAGQRLSYGHMPRFVKPVRDKSYTVFMYYVGARKLEPAKVLKENMFVTGTHIVVDIPAFKHGERAGPLEIRRDRPGTEWIILRWQKTRKGRQIWPLKPATAYRIIKRALGRCPHWLRHNFITTAQQKLEGQPLEVDTKIMAWTGIKRRDTLDNYRMKKQKDIKDISDMPL